MRFLTLTLTLLISLVLSATTFAISVSQASVSPIINGKIPVSNSAATRVTVTLTVQKPLQGLQYELSSIVAQIFYIENGAESALTEQQSYFAKDSKTPEEDITIPVSIPAGKVGVKLLVRWYVWNYDRYLGPNSWDLGSTYIYVPPYVPTSDFPIPVFEFQGAPGEFNYFFTTSTGGMGTFFGPKFQAFEKQVAGTVPVYRFDWINYSGRNQYDYYYSTDPNAITTGINGWESKRIAFYAYANPTSERIPVHRFYDLKNGKYYLTADPIIFGQFKTDPNWRYDGIAFYSPQPAIDPVVIYEYYNENDQDHFLSSTPNLYQNGNPRFKAFNSLVPGTVPVYQFYIKHDAEHAYFLDYSQGNDRNWFTYQKIAFYVYTSNVPGTIPIYTLYHESGIHYLTPDANEAARLAREDPNWTNYGTYFYAFPL